MNHPSRGAIFESWMVSEVLKARFNLGVHNGLSHLRTRKGAEVDLIAERSTGLSALEAKSGSTISSDFFSGLDVVRRLVRGSDDDPEFVVVYGGDKTQTRSAGTALPWSKIATRKWG